MKNKPIIIVSGEPYSIFSEIFFKLLKSNFIKNYNRPLLLIGSKNMIEKQMKKMNFSFNFNLIAKKNIHEVKFNNKKINIINVDLNFKKPFDKISNKSSNYIKKCFDIGLDLMKKKVGCILINGPISKKHFFNGKFNGVTEYLANKTKHNNKEVMLIYNKSLSVCPITTHIPLKDVPKKISSSLILKKIITINDFYKKNLRKTPIFAVTGLNPHCESNFKRSEEKKIISPAIKKAKKIKIKIQGPFPADTTFSKINKKKYDVIIGMYHDQVLTPMKTLFNFNAINITLGLPFIRISPDHGTNNQMLGLGKSDPTSLKEALHFIKKINVS